MEDSEGKNFVMKEGEIVKNSCKFVSELSKKLGKRRYTQIKIEKRLRLTKQQPTLFVLIRATFFLCKRKSGHSFYDLVGSDHTILVLKINFAFVKVSNIKNH